MRRLKVCLWIAGVLCLLSLVGVVLPQSALGSMVSVFGGMELPDVPVFVYAVRVASATYAAIGVYLIILALNPLKYGVLVPFTGAAAVFLGVVCLVTGVAAHMPTVSYLVDSMASAVLGILFLVSWPAARAEGRKAQSDA
jgi:hypothetical protein